MTVSLKQCEAVRLALEGILWNIGRRKKEKAASEVKEECPRGWRSEGAGGPE